MATYLALGDSYTIGEGVEERERWPVVLSSRLRRHGVAVTDVQIVAKTGWTTDELDAAMDEAQLAGRYDLASLLIGVNNQYRGRSVENFALEFAALLDRALALVGGRPERLFVLTIPDWGVTPFGRASGRDPEGVSAEIDAYNAVVMGSCRSRRVACFEITAVTRRMPDAVTGDGLHPDGSTYQRWIELVEGPLLAQLLQSPASDGDAGDAGDA